MTADRDATRRLRLAVEYDGQAFDGWQRQSNGQRTVQGVLEAALSTLLRETVNVVGSGRTDAGVHAIGQVAHLDTRSRWLPETLRKAANAQLPADVVIREIRPVPAAFHARYSARSKRYRYTIYQGPTRPAVGRHHAWWIRGSLDLRAMRQAADLMVGQHDCAALGAAGSPRRHTVRTIHHLSVDQHQQTVRIEIEAEGFLYRMARRIVGLLVVIGQGRLQPADVRQIFTPSHSAIHAPTAPAHGLCLVDVSYDPSRINT